MKNPAPFVAFRTLESLDGCVARITNYLQQLSCVSRCSRSNCSPDAEFMAGPDQGDTCAVGSENVATAEEIH